MLSPRRPINGEIDHWGSAKQAQVRIETLRYYERMGLVARPPRVNLITGSILKRQCGVSCLSSARKNSAFLSKKLWNSLRCGQPLRPPVQIFVHGR